MAALAYGIVVAAGLVVALLLLLLSLPVQLTFRIDGSAAIRASLTGQCLFGLLHFDLRLPSTNPQPPAQRAARRRPRPGLAALQQAFGSVAFRQRARRLVQDLLAASHLQQLRLRLRLGLGDPAETGCLWAVLGPISAWARKLRDAQVQIEPDFVDAVFEFRAQGQARLVPLRLLGLVAGFALSPASVRAWQALRRRRG